MHVLRQSLYKDTKTLVTTETGVTDEPCGNAAVVLIDGRAFNASSNLITFDQIAIQPRYTLSLYLFFLDETSVVNLKSLMQREMSEGLTEEELASTVGVSVQTITEILADNLTHDPAIWDQFALYFHMDVNILRSGGPPHEEGLFDLITESAQLNIQSSPLQMRKVPLLKWDQIDQMIACEEPPRLIQAEMLLETDVPGKRTFTLQVRDNSMLPLISEGEIMFVDPDLPGEPGQYVLVESEAGHPEGILVRQLKNIEGHARLHPLNREYPDLPVTTQRTLGRVVRLRKNL